MRTYRVDGKKFKIPMEGISESEFKEIIGEKLKNKSYSMSQGEKELFYKIFYDISNKEYFSKLSITILKNLENENPIGQYNNYYNFFRDLNKCMKKAHREIRKNRKSFYRRQPLRIYSHLCAFARSIDHVHECESA